VGESRRFPLRQHWHIVPLDNAASVVIQLEILAPLGVEEYHTSVGLRIEYDAWRTDHESGVFGEIAPQADLWKHLNRSFLPGTRISASGPSLPAVFLEAGQVERAPTCRMTAINTSYRENARILQALCTSDTGELHFEPGLFTYFSGTLRIDGNNESASSPTG